MEAKLVLVAEDGRSGEFKLRLPTILGRSRQAGLTVLHTSVSRQHCEFTEYEGQLVVNDLGSLNGTFIEDTRISEPTILPHGARLRVGSVNFHADYGGQDDLAPPQVVTTETVSDEGIDHVSHSGAIHLLPPGAEHEPNEAHGHSPPPTEPLTPIHDGVIELEMTFEDDPVVPVPPHVAKPAPTKTVVPKAPVAAPKVTLQKPSAPPLPTPLVPPLAPLPPTVTNDPTINFSPQMAEPHAGDGEAFADDLDSFFNSLL